MFEDEVLSPREKLRKIRKMLGVTQSKFAQGIYSKEYICQLENNREKITGGTALNIIKRAKSIAKSKGIEFDMTVDEFMESVEVQTDRFQNRKIEKAIEKLEKNINEKSLKNLDYVLSIVSKEKVIKAVLKVLSILKKDLYTNAELILKYSLKIISLYTYLDKKTYAEVNLNLIRAYNVLEKYYVSIIRANEIQCLIKEMEVSDQVVFYWNVASAYYYVKEYDNALRMIYTAQMLFNKYNIDKDFNEIRFSSLKCNILMMQRKFTNAIILSKDIIEKAEKSGLNDYIANSKSNIAYMLTEDGDLDNAKIYIDEALSMPEISIIFRINIMDNLLELQIKTNTRVVDIKETFYKLIELAIITKNDHKIKASITMLIDYYIKNAVDIFIFWEALFFLKEKNICIDPNVKLEIIKYFKKDDGLIKEILAL